MREAIPYKIIGGVRFYERKEIKDALAFLKLIINPHDDVSLRRVINVPARGVGKGVMDSLQAIDPEASLGGFVDRLSLLSETDEESGNREARVWLMTAVAASRIT